MTDRSRFLGDATRLAALLVRADVRGAGARRRSSPGASRSTVRIPSPAIPDRSPELAPETYVALASPLPAQPPPKKPVAPPLAAAVRSTPLVGPPARVPDIPPIAEPVLHRTAPLAVPLARDAVPPSARAPLESPPENLAEALNLEEMVLATPQVIDCEEETTEVKLPPLAGALDAATVAENLGATTSGDSLEERFEIFVGWLVGATGAMAVFVADTDGLSIEKRMAPEAYVAASATLGQVQDSLRAFVPSPPEGSTTVELDGQNILQLIWTDTELGRLVTGLVLSEPLQAIERGRIRSILRNLLATRRNTNGKSVSE